MNDDLLRFAVTRLSATVPEGVPITWRGREFASGPLTIELAPCGEGAANRGVLDYGSRRARAEFHVRLSFPQFAEVLDDLGVDPRSRSRCMRCFAPKGTSSTTTVSF